MLENEEKEANAVRKSGTNDWFNRLFIASIALFKLWYPQFHFCTYVFIQRWNHPSWNGRIHLYLQFHTSKHCFISLYFVTAFLSFRTIILLYFFFLFLVFISTNSFWLHRVKFHSNQFQPNGNKTRNKENKFREVQIK